MSNKQTDQKSQVQSAGLKLEEPQRMFSERTDKLANCNKLTIAELRSIKGFETIPESEGLEIIEGLFQLAVIAADY
jgi:hypothetical protein